MCGNLGCEQRYGFHAAALTQVAERQAWPLARMHRRAALKIGQCERTEAVAAVGGSEQGKQGGILRNRQDLAVAKRPPCGSKVAGKYSNFGDKRICHISVCLILSREDSEQGNDKINAQKRLHVCMRLASACGADALGIHVGVRYIAEKSVYLT